MSINITERLRKGREAERQERAVTEAEKLGVLRAGMTGIMSETGDIAGTCHRKTHLRALGVELEQPDLHKLIMFELGFASEDITAAVLGRSLLPSEILLREEEIPIEWQTRNGTRVTGRPDIVLCTEIPSADGISRRPVLGLELKSVHSIWTARDVLFSGQPKMGNLAQAAHYMWKLNIPYKLVYKAYSQLGQSMSDWATKFFPRQGEPNSQYVDYNPKGGVKGLKQFEIVYDLMIDSKGRVCYKLEEQDEAAWKRSIVTTGDIERYYEYVAEMSTKRELGPRPLTIDAHGEKLNYKDCSYCSIQSVCDTHEKSGYETWLREVKNKCNQNPESK
jgi:hypothetical protein